LGGWDEGEPAAQPVLIAAVVHGLHSVQSPAMRPAPGPAELGKSKSDEATTLGRETIGTSFSSLPSKQLFEVISLKTMKTY
jgi:hypothetical protein